MGDAGEISGGGNGFRWRAGEGKGEEGDDRWVRPVSGGAGDSFAGAGRRVGRAGLRREAGRGGAGPVACGLGREKRRVRVAGWAAEMGWAGRVGLVLG